MSSLFGSHTQQKSVQQSAANSSSANQAYGTLSNAFSPVLGQTAQSGDYISQLLGLSNGTGGADAFNKYLGSTGYNFALNQGTNAITSNAASRGLLDSGATGKALEGYGQNLGSQYFNNYLTQLLGLGNQGIQAGQVLSGAGNTSNSQAASSGASGSESGSGIGGFTGIAINSLLGKSP
jgi:hypothetical protein